MKFNSYSKGEKSNPAVVLIHGLLGASRNLYRLAERISNSGFYVIAYDQRGHGHSEHGATEDYTLDVLSNDLFDVMDEYELQAVHVIGHSLGGRVALSAVGKRPEKFLSLSMLDVGVRIHPDSFNNISGIVTALSDSYENKKEAEEDLAKFPPALKAFLFSNLRTRDGKLHWIFDLIGIKTALVKSILDDQSGVFKRIRCPILLARGEQSDHFKLAELDYMLELNQNVESVTIPHAGHWLHADNFEATAQAILSFLTSLKK